jgi:ankyrin repeat protein
MPTQAEQSRNRVLLKALAALAVVGGLLYMGVSAQQGLNHAAERGRVSEVQEFLKAGGIFLNRSLALESAISAGKGQVVRYLVEGKLVNPEDGLMAAAESGRANILRVLLENGADVRGDKGGQILWRAAQSGNKESVYLLLRYGANRDFANSADEQLTPLMYAAYSGEPGVVKAFVDAHARVHAQTTKGKNALMLASEWNKPLACKYLLQAGVDINARDSHGQTALMAAAKVDNDDVVHYLLSCGASRKIRDKAGKSALDYAIERGSRRSANRLRNLN